MNYLYQKEIEVVAMYDVVICGGGPAGFTAAVQAGRLGAKVALVEKGGMLGGTLTSGGNNEISLFYAHGKQIISGVGWEFVQRLNKKGWAVIPDFSPSKPHWDHGVKVNVTMAAHEMDTMCEEVNVKLFFEQPLTDAIISMKNEARIVEGIIVATKSGPKMMKGSVFIDCTGDGDLAAFAGAEFEKGDAITKELQPGTLRAYLTGFDLEDIDKEQVDKAFKQARQNEELKHGDVWFEDNSSAYTIFRDKGNNINHVHPLDGADSDSLSVGQIAGRNSVARITQWARECVRGAEKCEPITCASSVGVRETRRILGETYITAEDYISAKSYPDAVCYSYYPIDLHTHEEKSLVNIFHEKSKVPTIPYGALIPKGFKNLLTAGRCISGDRLANSAFRVKASCMAMGQVVGAAATITIKTDSDVVSVSIRDLKETLKKQGAIVP